MSRDIRSIGPAPAAQRGVSAWLSVVLVATAALLASAAAGADAIYRSTDAEGRTVFSDQPPRDGAQPVEMAPLMIYEAQSLPRPERTEEVREEGEEEEEEEEDRTPYDELAIVSPVPDEAVRDNAGNVTIHTRLRPRLQSGHRIELVLDGERRATATTGSAFPLTNVDRGTHVVSARVVDGNDRILITSQPVEFHMLRTSILTRPGN